MNTKYINYNTIKLVVCWFVSIQISTNTLTSIDAQYSSIMNGGLFFALSTIAIAIGMTANVKSIGFWLFTSAITLLSFNMYMWLTPFTGDVLPNWAWIGVVVVSFVTVTSLFEIRKSLLSYPSVFIDIDSEKEHGN